MLCSNLRRVSGDYSQYKCGFNKQIRCAGGAHADDLPPRQASGNDVIQHLSSPRCRAASASLYIFAAICKSGRACVRRLGKVALLRDG